MLETVRVKYKKPKSLTSRDKKVLNIVFDKFEKELESAIGNLADSNEKEYDIDHRNWGEFSEVYRQLAKEYLMSLIKKI